MKRLLFTAATLIGLGASLALGQVLIQQSLTGSEAILGQGGGPGGPGFFTNVNALRDAHNYTLVGAGSTVTVTVSPNVGEVVITGAITTLNLSLPAVPYDGQTVRVSCPGGIAGTVVVSAYGGGTTNGLGATIAPATSVSGQPFTSCTNTVISSLSAMWTFVTTPNIWQRIQ
jgi:hypothetical protein